MLSGISEGRSHPDVPSSALLSSLLPATYGRRVTNLISYSLKENMLLNHEGLGVPYLNNFFFFWINVPGLGIEG